MHVDRLECPSCGTQYDWQEDVLLCRSCASPTYIKYRLKEVQDRFGMSDLVRRPTSVWRYREVLPITAEENIISLQEGWTPLVQAGNYGRAVGLKRLYLKLEYLNPTGSLKDRGSTVMISRAKEIRVESVVDDSSGNAGASIAAYCAKAEIKCTIYVPMSTPSEKLIQASMYGARVVKTSGSRSDTARTVRDLYNKREIYYASHNLSPFFVEGMKTFAYELVEQTNRELPKHIVFPVGGGTLLVGAAKGFEEMIELGWIEESPAIHCIQSAACMPIVTAHRSKLSRVEAAEEHDTIAGGIRIADPPRGSEVLNALYDTGGSAADVSDEEILQHQQLLAETEGIFAEPTSCAALAGLPRLLGENHIDVDEPVVVPVTGFGLKDTKSAAKSIR